MTSQSTANALVWLLGITLALLMAGGILWSLRRRDFTDEEFERERRRASLLRTGLQEFQGFLEPGKKMAMEIVKEEKRKREQQQTGGPPVSGSP